MAADSRQCPTRIDGGDPLIAHWISLPTCRRREREHYHKCFTCVHALGREALDGVPPGAGAASGLKPPPRPALPRP